MKFNLTAHKELWNWLAENPSNKKEDWPGWEENAGKYKKVDELCFACQYANDVDGKYGGCRSCPLDGYKEGIGCLKGLFIKWEYAHQSLQERSGFACQIANLPVREGVECE